MGDYETLAGLVEALTEYVDAGYGDLKVRVAEQPSWPIRLRVSALTVATHDDDKCFWLATDGISSWSDESPYAPRAAWEGGVEGEDFYPDELY